MHSHVIVSKCIILIPMAIIKRWGPGISPSYYKCDPRLLLLENRRKIEPKVTPSSLIPQLLVVFTQQLGTLGDNPACHLLPSIIKISFDTCTCTLRKIMV